METVTDVSTQLCENCKKQVSTTNYSLHSAHCHRNICLCEFCKEPYPRNEIEQHINENHTKIRCDKCGQQIERQEADTHMAEECTKRLVKCNICEIDIPDCELHDHIDYCGSRTELCQTCGRYVMLKFLDIHLSSNHSFLSMDDDKPKPERHNVPNFDLINDVNSVPSRQSLRLAEDTARPVITTPTPMRFPLFPRNLFDDLEYSHERAFDDLVNVHHDTTLPTQTLEDEFDNLLTFNDRDSSIFRHQRSSSDPFLDEDFGNFHLTSSTFVPEIAKEDARLPCEFCGELIYANLLMHHQDTCNAEPSPPISSQQYIFNRRDNDEPALDYNSTANETVTLIPCEYCNKTFDAEIIIEHQTGCTEMRHVEDPPRRSPPPVPNSQPLNYVDDDTEYINDLLLNEAIENSLKGSPAKSLETNLLTSVRAPPKVRNVPITLESNHVELERPRNGIDRPPSYSDLPQSSENNNSQIPNRQFQTTGTRPKSLSSSQANSAQQDPVPKPPARRRPHRDQ